MRCEQCQRELELIAGQTTIRLYRCSGCGSQLMLPGAPGSAAAVSMIAPAPDRIEDPISAAAALIAAHPGRKVSPALIVVLIAIALGVLLLVARS